MTADEKAALRWRRWLQLLRACPCDERPAAWVARVPYGTERGAWEYDQSLRMVASLAVALGWPLDLLDGA